MLAHSVARRVTFLIAVGALVAATGCIHVSSRVRYNGEAMSSTWQYRSFMLGDRSPSTLRAMYYSSDARNLGHRSVAYPAFGRW